MIECPKCQHCHEEDEGERKCEICGFAFTVEIEYDPEYTIQCVECEFGPAYTVPVVGAMEMKTCRHCNYTVIVKEPEPTK